MCIRDSIYIDRYPFGREATVNWPNVDLQVGNPTDWPIVIWTEYTDDSITVKLFGTAVVQGEVTAQTSRELDECTRVATERTRTWVDGRTEVDTVWATYQPEEGLGCDGEPTAPPPECGDAETLIDTTQNGVGDSCAPLEAICPPPSVPVDEDGDGLFDFCNARVCPPDTIETDTNGDGEIDRCLLVGSLPPTSDTGTDTGEVEETSDPAPVPAPAEDAPGEAPAASLPELNPIPEDS